jgi:uncharacterized protein
MNTLLADPTVARPGRAVRILDLPLVRIMLAIAMVMVPLMLLQAATAHLPIDKSMRKLWPALLSIICCYGMFRLYVQHIEKRALTELAQAKAWRDVAGGSAIGSLMFCSVLSVLYATGAYDIIGSDRWTVMIAPLFSMMSISLLEEILFRGIVFRILQDWLGSWRALVVSVVVFSVAQLVNEEFPLPAVASVAAAGVLLGAAYMATGRLWLGIGIHFAWNFTQGAVFSAHVPGDEGSGMIFGTFTGPNWLTGGPFGASGSAVAVGVLLLAGVGMLACVRRERIVAPSWRGPIS